MPSTQKTIEARKAKFKSLLNTIILAQHREFEARSRMIGAVDITLTVLKDHQRGGCSTNNDDAITLLLENLSREENAWNDVAGDLYQAVEKMCEEIFGRDHFIATAKQIDKEVA